ncbi:MAG: hypothetical protein JNM58_01985 [Xanthomonadaceae bacterium]|nr:hypothetical protein [Xanthomonadaceae bacterium]
MNTCIRLSLALAVGLSLSGCATTSEFASAPAAAPAQQSTKYSPRIEDDAAYIAYVERTARRRGIIVHWVHKPVKRNVDIKD